MKQQNHRIINFDSKKIEKSSADVIVVGSGVGGLQSAKYLSKIYKKIYLITKRNLSAGNTNIAQGGIAVVLRKEDSFEKHIKDTLYAGAGLCDKSAVEILVKYGKKAVEGLIKDNAPFDRIKNKLLFTKEAAHCLPRIIHGYKDATGRMLEEFLIGQTKKNKRIKVLENHYLVEILVKGKKYFGIIVAHKGRYRIIYSKILVVATGGIGRIYRETTNHITVTGDGIAAGIRAGLDSANMEFVQFHPTTLYVPGAPRFLISESVRGEGAVLRNINKQRFMKQYHKLEDLAPRDVVSRSVLTEMLRTHSSYVYLDFTDLKKDYIRSRFPNIYKKCLCYGIDITKALVPVRPSAHYFMGGIKVDLFSRTKVENLYYAGETSCTGVHGANRLASNSLLEALAFGYRIYERESKLYKKRKIYKENFEYYMPRYKVQMDLDDIINTLRSIMWRKVGIVRTKKALIEAEKELNELFNFLNKVELKTVKGFEAINMLTVGLNIIKFAKKREKSIGAHFITG